MELGPLLPPAPRNTSPPPADEHPLVLRLPVGTRLADAERRLILMTLEALRGNKQRAARVLGISRRGLYSKLQAFGEQLEGAEPSGSGVLAVASPEEQAGEADGAEDSPPSSHIV